MWMAFFIGFLGGFHCMVMCGPLILFLRHHRKNYSFYKFGMHQLSRILGYTILGGIAGLVGYGFSVASLQQYVALTLGGLLLYAAISSLIPMPKFFQFNKLIRMKTWLSSIYSRLSSKSIIPLGILHALLPCGLVYTALAASTALFDPLKSMLFMCFFGLGTLPALGLTYLLPISLLPTKKKVLRFVLPTTTGIIGILLILRGLAIGIAFLSPVKQHLNVAPQGSQYECAEGINIDSLGNKKAPERGFF